MREPHYPYCVTDRLGEGFCSSEAVEDTGTPKKEDKDMMQVADKIFDELVKIRDDPTQRFNTGRYGETAELEL